MADESEPWRCWVCGVDLNTLVLRDGDTIAGSVHPLLGDIVLCPRCTVEVGLAPAAKAGQAAGRRRLRGARGGRLAAQKKAARGI